MTYPAVDFVVPARNEERVIERCLQSIKIACDRAGVMSSIHVMDNGSIDATAEIGRNIGAEVSVLPGHTVGQLRDKGAELGFAPLIAFVDADIELSPEWLSVGIELLSDDTIVLVGASPNPPSDASWVAKSWNLLILARPARTDRTWLGTSNMLVRRDAYLRAIGFASKLETGEDVDFCYRISAHGRIVSDARMKAVHYGECQSLRELFRKEIWRGSWSFRGALLHGLKCGELPSLLHPIASLTGALAFLVGTITGAPAIAGLGATLFFAFPLLMSMRIAIRVARPASIPNLFLVWTTYAAARAVAALVEVVAILRNRQSR